MARPSFPTSLRQFQLGFAREEACHRYLAACRWPDGFPYPRWIHQRAFFLVRQRRWQCVTCRHQVSLTSGTVLPNTKAPLTLWFLSSIWGRGSLKRPHKSHTPHRRNTPTVHLGGSSLRRSPGNHGGAEEHERGEDEWGAGKIQGNAEG